MYIIIFKSGRSMTLSQDEYRTYCDYVKGTGIVKSLTFTDRDGHPYKTFNAEEVEQIINDKSDV
jgi:hypothetical protein